MKATAFFALEALFFLNPYSALSQVETAKTELIIAGLRHQVTHVYNEILVQTSPQKAWDAIAMEFPKMGDFYTGMDYSYAIDKSVRNGLHATRHCQLDENRYVRERIVSWNANQMNYAYQVYEAEGLDPEPLQFEMGVLTRDNKTYIYSRIYYPNDYATDEIQMKQINQERILAYCNYIEHDDYSKPSFEELAIRYALD